MSLFLIATLFSLKSAADPKPSPGTTGKLNYTISGRVLDTQGQPVEGAAVDLGVGFGTILTHAKTTTDANGRYTLPFQYTFGGSKTAGFTKVHLTVHKPGYYETSLAQFGELTLTSAPYGPDPNHILAPLKTVFPDMPFGIDFVLATLAKIHLQLLNASGAPIADKAIHASLTEYDPLKNQWRTTVYTDASGQASLEAPCMDLRFATPKWHNDKRLLKSDPVSIPTPRDYWITLKRNANGELQASIDSTPENLAQN